MDDRSVALNCPPPAGTTLSRYPAHAVTVAALPAPMQQRLSALATRIRASFRPGCRPFTLVRIVGHADRDRRGAAFERDVSRRRAEEVERTLRALVGPPASRIRFLREAAGATRLVVTNPVTEEQRRENRRTEVVVGLGVPDGGVGPGLIRVRGGGVVGPLPPGARLPGLGELTLPLPGGRVNVREDVLKVMDRIHVLWSISNPDYNVTYPSVQALPSGSTVDLTRFPRIGAAIRRNGEAHIHNVVARNLLQQPLSQPVGQGQPTLRDDVMRLQSSLRVLRQPPAPAPAGFRPAPGAQLLSEPDFASERAAIAGSTGAVNPAVIPRTLAALRAFKDLYAGFRLGWFPMHAEELEAGGDRFGGRTYDIGARTLAKFPNRPPAPNDHVLSMFVPSGASAQQNRVHVFFGARETALDIGGNDVVVHGLRSAAESSDWIVIGVEGIDGGFRTIDDDTIASCLARAGRPTAVTEYRVSGHSRGVAGMRETLNRGLLRAAPMGRIFVLDAANIYRRQGNRNTLVYKVVVGANVPGATGKSFNAHCMRAIGFSRLIQNAMVTNPALVVPPAIRAQLLTLPARGCLAFMRAPGTGCLSDVGQFCNRNQAAIARIIRQESNRDGLLTFITNNNLFRSGPFTAGIYSHHLFVAEMAHELFAP